MDIQEPDLEPTDIHTELAINRILSHLINGYVTVTGGDTVYGNPFQNIDIRLRGSNIVKQIISFRTYYYTRQGSLAKRGNDEVPTSLHRH